MAVVGVTIRHLLCLLVISFAVSYICVPLVRKLAVRLGAIDYPDARRVNKVPIPRMGGVAIAIGVFVTLLVQIAGEFIFGWAGFYVTHNDLHVNHAGVILGLALITLVGAIDDVKSLPPKVKFLGQIAAASVIAIAGVRLSEIANPLFPGFIEFGWLSYPITIFYLVAFMNAINLVDGLDGLAGGIAAIASATMFVIAAGNGRVETAMLSAVLLGATLAFLRFNRAPASIFMGDSGSLLLGAMLGVISLLGVMRSPAIVVLGAPLIVAAIPIADTFFAIVRRKANHQSISQPDKGHLHHVFLREGFNPKKAVNIIHAWTALLAVAALVVSNTHGLPVVIVFLAVAGVSLGILWKLNVLGDILRHHYNPRKKDGLGGPEVSVSIKAGHEKEQASACSGKGSAESGGEGVEDGDSAESVKGPECV